jgi:hypothetical protein
MPRIAIVTGSEPRHDYFRMRVALEPDIEVVAS